MRILSIIITLCVVNAAEETPVPEAPGPESQTPQTNQCPSAGCSAPSCRKLVYEMVRDIDEKANPVDDFSKYACGNWEKAHTSGEDAFSNAGVPVRELVVDLLQKEQGEGILSLAGQFYRSCTDAGRRGISALLEMRQEVFDEFGGWPLPCDSPVKVPLANVMVKATLIRGNGILDLVPEVRQVNGTKELVLKVKRYTRNIYGMMLSERFDEEITDFERKLQAAQGPRRSQFRTFGITTERKYDLDEFKEKFKLDMIDDLLSNLYAIYGIDELLNIQLTVEDRDEGYLSNLTSVLSTVSKRIQFNYILYNLFSAQPLGLPPSPERCLRLVRQDLPLALNRLFAENVFTKEYTDGFATLEKYVRAAYVDLFNQTTIGNAEDKTFLLEKLKHIKISHGYSRSLFDDELITNYFSPLQDLGDNYVKNAINVRIFEKARTLRIRWAPEELKGLQHDLASLGSLSVPAMNAHYTREDNRIFMAPALLKAFYRKDGPMSHNFGIVGYVLGHEIGHAFDDDGIKTSKEGHLRDAGYISDAATEHYLSVTSCLEERFQLVADSIPWAWVQSQLISDNLGMFAAYQGYKNWVAEVPEREASDRLPFLRLSGEQILYTAAARVWCNKPYSSQSSRRSRSFMTIRILMNSLFNDGFGDAFQYHGGPPGCVYFR